MTDLKDIMAYLVKKYPFKHELSNARVTKIVYLADWRNSIINQKQISDIQWKFDDYGPFVWDILNTAKFSTVFDTLETTNPYGQKKVSISLKNSDYNPNITESEKEILDYVISKTMRLNWDGFIKLVYSTYPILKSERYSELNLVEFAKQYLLENGGKSE